MKGGEEKGRIGEGSRMTMWGLDDEEDEAGIGRREGRGGDWRAGERTRRVIRR